MRARFRPPVRVTLLGLGLAAALGAPAAAADTYKVDAVHSAVFFRAKHFGAGHVYGRFNDFSGMVVFDEKDPAACSVEVEVKAESVDSNEPKRDQHLRTPDFLNAKEFPTLSFKSTSVKKNAKGEFEVTGDFTLRGVTKSITVRAAHLGTSKVPRGGSRAGFETVFTIKRSEYGVKYMPQGLGEDVQITVALEGEKE